MRDLDDLVSCRCKKNTDSWHARKEDLQRAFPLDVLMVPLSAITVAIDGERLICGGWAQLIAGHLPHGRP
jgi:DMSO/TMAO reductase YedYZ molybdopterin-dependent catalytic subunit